MVVKKYFHLLVGVPLMGEVDQTASTRQSEVDSVDVRLQTSVFAVLPPGGAATYRRICVIGGVAYAITAARDPVSVDSGRRCAVDAATQDVQTTDPSSDLAELDGQQRGTRQHVGRSDRRSSRFNRFHARTIAALSRRGPSSKNGSSRGHLADHGTGLRFGAR